MLHQLARRPLLATARANVHSFKPRFNVVQSRPFTLVNKPVNNRVSVSKAIGALGLGLGLSVFARPSIHCEGTGPASPPIVTEGQSSPPNPVAAPPPSIINVYELSFGTVAGICAGIFIKKGAKIVAFFVGGVFVLLQYFGSLGFLKVDWARVGSHFEHRFYATDPKTGSKAPPTIYVVWKSLVDFLTADFQPRASFMAGLVLGLRVG
ncbi:FUN14 family-domain-containing protein [Roridomyces roridus]|uniref:FUN14 family-domain-containing protein n=1 Tax=Roridomyces roridus TaxID=1738132 RepID=A0AAD7BWP4_9AGAR|nr:FUN14 family-domain-containing protein [Roridomyces roridus]